MRRFNFNYSSHLNPSILDSEIVITLGISRILTKDSIWSELATPGVVKIQVFPQKTSTLTILLYNLSLIANFQFHIYFQAKSLKILYEINIQ